MEAMHDRDLVAVGQVLRQVLDQGLDLGFFLRELTNCWRNMFLLRQAGESALPLLGLSGEEAASWMDWANRFDPAHIHASWQMTLDGQRKVMTSLEPALALELLLLNLTCLPDLVNLETVTARPTRGDTPAQRPMTGGQGGPTGGIPSGPAAGPEPGQGGTTQKARQSSSSSSSPVKQYTHPVQPSNSPSLLGQQPEPPVRDTSVSVGPSDATPMTEPPVPGPQGPRDWKGFLKFVEQRNGQAGIQVSMLHLAKGERHGNELVVTCRSRIHCEQLSEKQTAIALDLLAKEYFGQMVDVRVETGDIEVPKSNRQLQEEAENHPGVTKVMEAFSAQMVSVDQRKR